MRNTMLKISFCIVYSSGTTSDTTVSNYFDIQWRRYAKTSDARGILNNGSAFLVESFRLMGSKVLDNAIEPIEGLVVDTVQGGVGFRNHTAPLGFEYGATWDEDLLFIEPETVCVDTNITIDFSIGLLINGSNSIRDLVLTDRGGFSNLSHVYPKANLSNPQINPDLYNRAYVAAWVTNTYTMLFYNVTNPRNETSGEEPFSYLNTYPGKTFPLHMVDSTDFYDSLAMDGTFDSHLNLPEANDDKNIFGVSNANFSSAGKVVLDCLPEDI